MAGNFWDGAYHWLVSRTVDYNGQLVGNTNPSLLLTTTQRSCDCTGPTQSVDEFTLTSSVETLDSGLMIEPNMGAVITVGAYTLTYLTASDPNGWND